jgi:hypothetical protein
MSPAFPSHGIVLADRSAAVSFSKGKCREMASKLFRYGTDVSEWDFWQNQLPPFTHRGHPGFGLFLLVLLAGNVVLATFAWFLVGLFMR